MGIQINAFLNWALDEAQWPVSCPGSCTNEDFQYPLNKRLGGLQCWSASLGIKTWLFSHPALSLVIILTTVCHPITIKYYAILTLLSYWINGLHDSHQQNWIFLLKVYEILTPFISIMWISYSTNCTVHFYETWHRRSVMKVERQI